MVRSPQVDKGKEDPKVRGVVPRFVVGGQAGKKKYRSISSYMVTELLG